MEDENTLEDKRLIPVCSLNCGKCDIFLAPNEPKIAKELVNRFNGMWKNVTPNDFHCSTCRGNRVNCWTEECWFRECCVDNKNLNFCFKCEEFPCVKLVEWANENNRYKTALENLKKMKLK